MVVVLGSGQSKITKKKKPPHQAKAPVSPFPYQGGLVSGVTLLEELFVVIGCLAIGHGRLRACDAARGR